MAQREFLFHILFHSQDVAMKLPQCAKPVVAWHKRASAGCPHLQKTWFLPSWPLNLASRRQSTWLQCQLILGLAGLARRFGSCSSCSQELAGSPETALNPESLLLQSFYTILVASVASCTQKPYPLLDLLCLRI